MNSLLEVGWGTWILSFKIVNRKSLIHQEFDCGTFLVCTIAEPHFKAPVKTSYDTVLHLWTAPFLQGFSLCFRSF
ncbi:hypothetical protein, partial [Roseibium sediminis]|uniref:hypothetical protein n=1 Tax=Roseibium sediminis TaxID=1775174 RepID=UPI00195CD401